MRGTFRAALIVASVALMCGGFASADDQTQPPPVDQFHPVAGDLPPGVVHFQLRLENTEEGFIEMPRPVDPNTLMGSGGRTVGADMTTPGSGLPMVGGALSGARGGGGSLPRIEKTEREIKTVIRKLG